MKVSISWLKELVDLNISIEELVAILPFRSISTKEVTDNFIELDMKGYNRADLLSLRGAASEVAAVIGSQVLFKEPEDSDFAWNKEELLNTEVKVEVPDLCPFYTITRIEGLEVGKSSPEVVKKLTDSGLRSVDNITDITNLIMLEFGQPLHAFDADFVISQNIFVRPAQNDEKIVTLDNKERMLEKSDLVISDSQKAIAIAGVMGALNSEVKRSTKTILLEAAIFNPISVRKTTTRLGLPSEASKRFQHGLTKERLLQALDAAIKMYQELGGKATSVTMTGDFEDKVKKINLGKEKLEDLVGVKFENQEVENYLEKLNFKATKAGEGWEVEPPYYRLDINLEVDLIEEVARMYGYEKIPATKVSESKALQTEDPIFKIITDLRTKLAELGLTEVQTYSFYTQDVLNALGFDEENRKFLVKLANPISAETEYLRMNLWPNLVEALGRNLRRGFSDIAFLEIGKVFHPEEGGDPHEDYRLSIALFNNTDNPIEELVTFAKKLGLELKESTPEGVGKTLFHPKRFIAVEKDDQNIGALSEVHLRVLNKLGIEKRVAVLEIDL